MKNMNEKNKKIVIIINNYRRNITDIWRIEIMTKEDKEILIRDLCGRLPYGVKAYIKNWSKLDRKYYEGVYTVESIDPSLNNIFADSERSSVEVIVGYYDYEIKPYLFPMSSMTEEQCYDFYCRFVENEIDYNDFKNYYFDGCLWNKVLTTINDCGDIIDWFNKNHFDYRGLIEKGLAIDATGLNIY